jgi:hypothetical protein
MNLLRPYKSDIKQIESLVRLGCNKSDIAMVLHLTKTQLNKWEYKNTQVAELLKPKALPEYTLNHPDYAPIVEEAFTCAGKRYYRFKEEYRMSTGRYKYYYSTLRELELKLSLSDLEKYVSAFELVLNGGAKKKTISLTSLHELLVNLKSRIKLAFDTSTIKRLAAIAYFDETEDLTTFSEKYGNQKLEIWEDHKIYDFFLTRPIGELFNLKNISADSLAEHLKVMDGIIKDLNSNLQTVLEDNS